MPTPSPSGAAGRSLLQPLSLDSQGPGLGAAILPHTSHPLCLCSAASFAPSWKMPRGIWTPADDRFVPICRLPHPTHRTLIQHGGPLLRGAGAGPRLTPGSPAAAGWLTHPWTAAAPLFLGWLLKGLCPGLCCSLEPLWDPARQWWLGVGGGVPLQPQVPPSCFPLLLPLNCSLALTDLPLSLPGELSDCKAACWPHARSHACSHAWGCCPRAPPCLGPRGQQRQRSWSPPGEPSPLTAPTSLGGLLFQALSCARA